MARLGRALLLASALALSAGCSGPDVVNALKPSDGYRVERALRYGPGPRGLLDLYLPDGAPADAPAVVFFYGGNWQSGARGDYRFVGQAFASQGFLAVIPDYRLYPLARFPDFLQDAAAAVAWTRDRLRGPDGAPRPLFLAGHSAGAYIAAMLTLDERWLEEAGAPARETVRAAAGLAGPYDFLPLRSASLKQIFGPEEGRAATQPINHADGDEPPLLLLTGDADATVRPGNTARLARRIEERGGRVEMRVYPNVGHIALVAALASPLRSLAPALEDLSAFFRRHLAR
jgi:acetyl esterase/lipase